MLSKGNSQYIDRHDGNWKWVKAFYFLCWMILPELVGSNPIVLSEMCNVNEENVKDLLICDHDSIFSDTEKIRLQREITNIYNETQGPCNISDITDVPRGYTVRMAVFKRYKEMLFPTAPSHELKHYGRIEAFAAHLQQYFAFDDICDDSVLIFISKEDKAAFLMAGEKTEDQLRTDVRQVIQKQMVDHLNRGKVLKAAESGLQLLTKVFRYGPDHVMHSSSAQHRKTTIIVVTVTLVLSVGLIGILCLVLRRRSRKRWEKRMSEMDYNTTVSNESSDEEEGGGGGGASARIRGPQNGDSAAQIQYAKTEIRT